MYVDSIEILNLRGFIEDKITFCKGMNVIVGANNSGKSTLIKALYSLTLNTQNILKPSDIRKSEGFSKIFIHLKDIQGVDEQARFGIHRSQLPKDNFYSQTVIKEIYHNRERESFYMDSSYMHLRNEESWSIENAPNIADMSTILKAFQGFSDNEDGDNFIYPFFAHRKTQGFSGQSSRSETYSINGSLRNLLGKVKRITNGSHPKRKEFDKYCEEILGFTVGAVPPTDQQSNEEKVGIYVDDNETIPIESMGDGVANILGIITFLLLGERKLYLIEEPENDIHPKALKQLLDLMISKAGSNQFIVSTHSNIVLKYLAGVDDSNIYVVNWTPFKVDGEDQIPTSVIKQVENTAEQRIKILEDLGYDLLDFDLYKGYLILEESSAESIINELFIPWFTPRLGNRLRTIACDGVSDLKPRFSEFRRIFSFVHRNPIYSKRAWVIADGDAAGKTAISGLAHAFKKTWPESHFRNFTKDNFEEYFPPQFHGKVIAALNANDKRTKKKELIDEVLLWAQSNSVEAKSAFENSASEVVSVLREIEQVLNSKD